VSDGVGGGVRVPAPAGAGEGACDCITCGDRAVPMRVRRIDDARGLALCDGEDGARSSVETALVEPVCVGDVLLVHAGTAIAHRVPA
jgi:hypothetical protein